MNDEIVVENLNLVYFIMKNLNLDFDEDVFQVGSLGLVKAARTYNDKKGIKFSTYASTCIRNEILMYKRKKYINTFSINEEKVFDNGSKVSYLDSIPSNIDVEKEVIFKIDIENFLSNLDEKEKFLLATFIMKCSQDEIAERLNISQSYVSRLRNRVLKKYKKYGGVLK